MAALRLSADEIASVLALIGIDATEVEQRKAYLELSDADAQCLRELGPKLHDHHDRLLDAFYKHLFRFDPTCRLLANKATVDRLKSSQRQYFSELTSGNYDLTYAINRIRVGLAHEQIGLEPRWYIGSYCKYLVELIPELFTVTADEPQLTQQALRALIKMAFLDIGLALDAYNAADRQSLLSLKELASSIVCSVPAGLVVLDKAHRIVMVNSYFDQYFPQGHALLRQLPVTQLFPELDLTSRINQVMHDGVAQCGILHTWLDHAGRSHSISITVVAMKESSSVLMKEDRGRTLLVVEDLSENERLRASTFQADQRIRAIMDNAAEGIISIDATGRIESFNKAAEQLFGHRAADILGQNVSCLMPEPYKSHHDEYLRRFAATGERRCMDRGFREVQGLAGDGRIFDMELSISEVPGESGRLFIGIVRDITERKRTETEMAKLSLALAQSADSVMITDRQGVVQYVNQGFTQTTGYEPGDILGKSPKVLKSGMQGGGFYHQLWTTILQGNVYRDILVNRRKDGNLYYEEKTITPLKSPAGEITHFISTGRDITERMQAQERLQFMAQHDILTSLPNRALFMDRVAQAIIHAARNQQMFAVLFLDLDRFKKINDTLGHHIGDAMLVILAGRLAAALRQGDTIARISGDEFAILLHALGSIDDVTPVLNKIQEQFKEPFIVSEHALFVSTSIGVTVFPRDGNDPATLIRNADTAMYSAKKHGRGTFSFYTRDMNALAEEQLYLENELRQALLRKQFHLVYQPQVRLSDKSLLGAETLLRWKHPERGLIPPIDFIYMLEDTGLIIPVGDWLLYEACAQLQRWHAVGLKLPRVAVNISPRQLVSVNFTQRVLQVLADCGLQPCQLELEITENSLMEDDRGAIQVLHELHGHGIQIAMDDFGTGYSSLSYLKQLPVSVLKIDSSFIRQLPDDMENGKLTNAIVAMGRSLNLNVVAEGVETLSQYQFLADCGCDSVQGYYISTPLEAVQFEQYISSARCN